MKTLLRTYLAVTLALMLALTGQSMAVARGTTSGPSGQMVLCTGTGPVSVHIDETDTPTPPPTFCPDCALNLLAVVALPDMMALPAIFRVAVSRPPVAHVHGVKIRTLALARAPPRVV